MNTTVEQSAHLQMAVRAAKVGFWDWDLRTNEVTYSAEWKTQLGYRDDELANDYREWESRLHPEDLPRIKKQLSNYLAKPCPNYEAEFRLRHKDGTWRWILAQADILRDAQGRPMRMLGSHIDITEHLRQREESIRKQEEERSAHLRFFEAMDRVNRAIQGAESLEQMMSDVLQTLLELFQCDRAWLVYPCDPEAACWRVPMERTRPEYPGGHADGGDFPMDADVAENMRLVREAERPVKFMPGTGHTVSAVAEAYGVKSFIAMALYPKVDKPYMFGLHQCSHTRIWTPEEEKLFQEVGRRMADSLTSLLVQRNLRQSQQAYEGLVNNIDGIVWEMDVPSFRFTFVSPQAERLLGYPVSLWKADAKFWPNHVHPEDRQRVLRYCQRATQEGRDHEFHYRMFTSDGRIVWLHDLMSVVVENGKPVKLRGIMVDTTESKRREEALRESEQQFRQVTESIHEVFWLIDMEKNELIYVSPAYEKIWGRTVKSVYAEPLSWLEAVQPSDRERVREAVTAKFTTGGYDLEYAIMRPDGAVRWIHDRAFPIRDAAGRIYRIAGLAEDVTERRKLEDQFRQAQKMDAIGQLAGGIAHDFNNLLSIIQMQASMLLDAGRLDEEAREGIQDIMGASERATNLTRQLLTFSRREAKQARDLEMSEIIGGMMKLLRRVLGEDIAVESRFASFLPVVNADPGMIEQVLLNLAVNSRDAMPNGGELKISLDSVEVDAKTAATHPGVAAGKFVCLTVRDNGCGIPKANLPRIFEPFFTTKEVGRGTGLGLAIVFGVAQQHHGWADVESQVGRGATFRVYFPASEKGVPKSFPESAISKLPGGTETILLVEDELTVRTLTRNVLERFGYRVIQAESAPEALRIWEKQPAAFDLLFTDLIMPGGISGRELATTLLAERPSLKVVYCSGYSDDVVLRKLRLSRAARFIQKPCSITELVTTVRNCLDAEADETSMDMPPF